MLKRIIINSIKWQIPTAMWGFVVLYLSLLPKVEVELPFEFKLIDKVVHLIFYSVLSMFLLLGLRFSNQSLQNIRTKVMLLGVIAYGGIIELLQHYVVVTRTGDWADFAANTAGVLVAYILVVKRSKDVTTVGNN